MQQRANLCPAGRRATTPAYAEPANHLAAASCHAGLLRDCFMLPGLQAAGKAHGRPCMLRGKCGIGTGRPNRTYTFRVARLSVLVVDDEKNIRQTLRICLES